MKKFLALGVLWVFLYAPACEGAEVAGGTSYKMEVGSMENCKATAEERAGMARAVEHYLEAGRKGDSKIAMRAFAPGATMSWVENGGMKSVPIKELYAYFDEKPRQVSGKIASCDVAGDVATVRVESRFDDASFTDMFSLVKDGPDWKIVSKIYHLK